MNWVEIYKRFCDHWKKVQNQECSLQRSPHRIIPGGIWGSSDAPENIVHLTLNQRVVAYKMLRRIYPYSKPIADECKRLVRERGKKPRKIPKKPRAPWPDHVRAKMSASHRGKTFSAESRLKMSASKRGKSQSPEHVAAKAASRIRNKKPISAAARHNMSISAKARAARVPMPRKSSSAKQSVTSTHNNWSIKQ